MKRDKRLVYWDTCIFLAWIKDEPWPQEIMDGIVEIIDEVYQDTTIIVTSVLTRTEILDTKITKDQANIFQNSLNHRNIQQANMDPPIADLSSHI